MVTTTQWCEKINDLIGTKYHHQGRNRHGVDCYGLLMVAAQELGVATEEMLEIRRYKRLPGRNIMREHIGKFLELRSYNRLYPNINQARLGDIIELHIDDRSASRHLGVINRIEDNLHYMVHADGRLKKVVETRIQGTVWNTRVHGIWYFPQFEET